MPSVGYRADIDGLRAIAILAVVAFHVGLPGARFGFIGVDVFFVISGFLITAILFREVERTGKIDLTAFYVRRIRRLVPALAVMILVVLGLGIWLLPPDGERQALGGAAMAAAGFLANLHGLAAQTGYFGRLAYTLPFLHMWTLSVEEQFYLVWPFVILISTWLAPTLKLSRQNALAICLGAGSAASLALALWLASHRPEAGFFLPFSRAWEFAAGAALALPVARRWGQRYRTVLGPAGLGLLLLTPGLYLGGAMAGAQVYSALALLPPVAGTALLIGSGEGAQATLVNRLLASRPLKSLGKVSYGWYLWHWPLLSLARINSLGEVNLLRDLGVALAALGLAILSWRLIEEPVRGARSGPFADRRGAIVCGGLLLMACSWADWRSNCTRTGF